MGQVVPFITRLRTQGAFSAEERARLGELADRYAAAGVRVQVIYGATDDGDPWCVVLDEAEEVLIHVARIGDTFVVHYAADDALRQGQDLLSILRERLAWEDRPEVVVPFTRQAQSLLALILAVSFFHETAGPGEDAPSWFAPQPAGHDPDFAAAGPEAQALPEELALASTPAALMKAGLIGLTPLEGHRPPVWRDFDDDVMPLRQDHGGLQLASFAPVGLMAPIGNIDVASPQAPDRPAPMLMALETHVRPAASAPEAPASNGFTASFTSSRKDGETSPSPQPSQAPQPGVAMHWIEIDTDGDGRPDTRIAVPVGPQEAPHTEPPRAEAPPDHGQADQEVILAVGQGFPHPEFV